MTRKAGLGKDKRTWTPWQLTISNLSNFELHRRDQSLFFKRRVREREERIEKRVTRIVNGDRKAGHLNTSVR